MGVGNYREQRIALGALQTTERVGTLHPGLRGLGRGVRSSVHVRGHRLAVPHPPSDLLRLPRAATGSGSLVSAGDAGASATLTGRDQDAAMVRRQSTVQVDESKRGRGRRGGARGAQVSGAQGEVGSGVGADAAGAGRSGIPPRKPPGDGPGNGVPGEHDGPEEQPDRGRAMREVVPIPQGELGAVTRLHWVTEEDITRFAGRTRMGDVGRFTGPLFRVPESYDPDRHGQLEGVTARYQQWLGGGLSARRIEREQRAWVGKSAGETTEVAISFDSLVAAVTSGTIQKMDGIGPKALPLFSAFVEDRRTQIALRSEIAWARNDVLQAKREAGQEAEQHERGRSLPSILRRILRESIRGEDAQRRYHQAGYGDRKPLAPPAETHATIFLEGIYPDDPRIAALSPEQRAELSARLIQGYLENSRTRLERRQQNAAVATRYIDGGTLEEIHTEMGNGDNADRIGHIAEWLQREYGIGRTDDAGNVLKNMLGEYIPEVVETRPVQATALAERRSDIIRVADDPYAEIKRSILAGVPVNTIGDITGVIQALRSEIYTSFERGTSIVSPRIPNPHIAEIIEQQDIHKPRIHFSEVPALLFLTDIYGHAANNVRVELADTDMRVLPQDVLDAHAVRPGSLTTIHVSADIEGADGETITVTRGFTFYLLKGDTERRIAEVHGYNRALRMNADPTALVRFETFPVHPEEWLAALQASTRKMYGVGGIPQEPVIVGEGQEQVQAAMVVEQGTAVLSATVRQAALDVAVAESFVQHFERDSDPSRFLLSLRNLMASRILLQDAQSRLRGAEGVAPRPSDDTPIDIMIRSIYRNDWRVGHVNEDEARELTGRLIDVYLQNHSQGARDPGEREVAVDIARAARMYADGMSLAAIRAALPNRDWNENEIALHIGSMASWFRVANNEQVVRLGEMLTAIHPSFRRH